MTAPPSDISGRAAASDSADSSQTFAQYPSDSGEDTSASTSTNFLALSLRLLDFLGGGEGDKDRDGGGRFGSMTRLSDVGTPALRISVSDVLRINFASFQSSPVPCERFTR